MPVRFSALEHHADGQLRPACYELAGSPRDGWEIRRDDRPHLTLGPGYELLRTRTCGICATDLARHRMPFPLPQVTGHEVVAEREQGGLAGVEINASHAARGLPHEQWCASCRAGLGTHCEDRSVLGIDRLPGGFAPWILAPIGAIVPLPGDLPLLEATMLEPFAAAWHAVGTIAPRPGDTVAVLGPGRLGTLIVAALAAHRRRSGVAFDLLAVAREPARAALARRLGADAVHALGSGGDTTPLADVVVETTGSAAALATALALARREVHLKSTSGEPACGLRHATELVVDELCIVPPDAPEAARPGTVRVASLRALDAAIRPDPAVARAAVPPRGTIVVDATADAGSPLLDAVARRGLRVTSSRCGDFRAALPVLYELARDGAIGALVRAVIEPSELAEGYAQARRPGAGKIVVRHPA